MKTRNMIGNIVEILPVILKKPATRDELVKLLNRPRSTIYEALAILIHAGVVQRKKEYTPNTRDPTKPGRGRPRIYFKLVKSQ